MTRTPLTALTLTTGGAAVAASAVQEVEGDPVGDGDAGVLDASVGGEDDGSGGGDAGLGRCSRAGG